MKNKSTDGLHYNCLGSEDETKSFIGKHYKVTQRLITISNEAIAKTRQHLDITATMLYPGPSAHFRKLC